MKIDPKEIQRVLNVLGYKVPNTAVIDPRTIGQ